MKKRQSKIMTAAAFMFIFFVLAVPYISFAAALHNKDCMSALLLRPTAGSNDFYDKELVEGIKKETLYIPAVDGAKIHAWLFAVPDAKTIAIVNHGNAGNVANRIYIANALVKAGCSVLLYDYRGYGLSTGCSTLDGITEDGITVYDYVHKKLHYAHSEIILYGESIGTGVTCKVAQARPCSGIILQSGIASLPSTGRSLFPLLWMFPDVIFAEPHLENAQVIKSLHIPILLLHGEKDHTVPQSESMRMYANANEPKRLILLPDCGHNDMGVSNSEQFHEAIETFVRTLGSESIRPIQL